MKGDSVKEDRIIAFVCGVCTGAAIAIIGLKKRCDQKVKHQRELYEERVNHLKNVAEYKGMTRVYQHLDAKNVTDAFDEMECEKTQPAKSGIADMPALEDYRDYRACYSSPAINMQDSEPHVISPTKWGEYNDYDQIFLTYYADGILAESDNDEIIEDPGLYVGHEWKEHIGDWEEDIVSVRNDKYKIDYEIVVDHRNYADVAGGLYPQEE